MAYFQVIVLQFAVHHALQLPILCVSFVCQYCLTGTYPGFPRQVFYIETISNPLLDIADIPAVAAFCQENSLTSVIDNTFASPAVVRQAPHTSPAALRSLCRSIMHMQICTHAEHV